MTDPANPTNPTPTNNADPGPGSNPAPNEFLTSLGDTFQGHEAFKDITDAQGLATRYSEAYAKQTELQAQIDGLPKPPESPDKYTMPEVPEGVKLNEEAISQWRQEAHKLGMSDEMFKQTLSVQFKMLADRHAQLKQEHSSLMEAKQKELGSKWDESLALVNQVVEKFGLAELLNQGDPSGAASMLRTNPVVFDAILKIGQAVDTDKLPGSAGPGSISRPTTPDGRPMFDYPSMKQKG